MQGSQDKRICKQCQRLNDAKATECSFCFTKMPEPIEVVISYSHKDVKAVEQLETHLSTMKRSNFINLWYDRSIKAGREWDETIRQKFATADVILLIVTPDFIASDFCYCKEMDWALQRHQNHETCVIPVIFRPTQWAKAPFSVLQALPHEGKPVTEWQSRVQALLNVAQGIAQAIEDRYKQAVL